MSINNGNIPVGPQTSANSSSVTIASDQTSIPTIVNDVTTSGTLTAATQTVVLSVANLSSGNFQIIGTWVGVISFEGSLDGTNWNPINAISSSTSTPQPTTTANGLYRLTPSGLFQIRANATSWTSGTATLSGRAGIGVGGIFSNQILPTKLTDGVSIAAIKPANVAAVATDQALVVALSPNNPISTTGLTDTQLRASPVPMSLTSTTITGSVAVTGPLTDTQLRASSLPISGTVTANLGTVAGVATETTLSTLNTKVPTNLTVTATRLLVDPSGVTSPVSAASLPLPTGASTSANQTITNTTLTSIDTKTPVLGQALAASSTPVVLTAAQITTLTPPTTVASTQSGNWSQRLQDGSGNAIASIIDGNGNRALEVAQAATSFVFSSLNSTSAQLAGGATYTGTVENVTNQQSVSTLLTSDKNGTLILNEYQDAAGTKLTRTVSYNITANIPFSRSYVINGNYFKSSFINSSGAATTTFVLDVAYGTIPSATSLGNSQVSLDEVNGTPISLQNGALPITLSNTLLKSYTASSSSIIPAAGAASDIFYISGSSTKTIRVIEIGISATQTTLGTVPIFIVKRSTATTGGSPTTQTNVPNDSLFPAATATVISNQGSPTLGTLVGNLIVTKMKVGSTTTAIATDELKIKFEQPVTLRGTNEMLAINLASANVVGGSYSIWIKWTEE